MDFYWNGFFQIGAKGNTMNTFVANLLQEYLMNETILADYFLIDFSTLVGYNNLPRLRELVDDVPINNSDVQYYGAHCFEPMNRAELEEVKKKTMIFKTTYKEGQSNEMNSLYQHVLRGTF